MSRPALVLIHGFTGAPSSWDPVVEHLAPTARPARVVRPTLCGHGAAVLDSADDFAGEVDRIAAELRAQGIEAAHLCGYSLGARVGLGLLGRHPSLFARATLIGVHPGLASDDERAARLESDERWARLALEQGAAAFVESWARQPVLATAGPVDDAALARQRALRLGHRPEGLARALRVLSLARMPDLRPALRSLAVPITLVVGAADAKFRALGEAIVALPARARLVVVDGAGHNVPLERPARVAALLEDATTPGDRA